MKWWIWFYILMLAASFFLITSLSAEELPPLDFSEYEVGVCYLKPDGSIIKVISMSEDKREMTSEWVIRPKSLSYQEQYYKDILEERRK